MPHPTDLARAMHGLVEPLHAVLYFAPEAQEEYAAIGLEPVAQGYFASRAAPLGAVGPGAVTGAFFNFNRAVVDLGLPGAWEIATPAQVLAARARAAERFFARIEAPTEGLAEAADLARRAGAGANLAGRPLAAANADVVPPGTPFADLWQALAVLREHRGDGHVALLVAAELTPVEALVLYDAWEETVTREFLQGTRLWDDDAWSDAAGRLVDRGWLDADGAMTEAGRAWRDQLEADTDALAVSAFEALDGGEARRLFDLLSPVAEALVASRAFPRRVELPDWPA